MTPFISFNPGPSQLYFTVQDHVRAAFREGVPSVSHRSSTFEKIFQATTEALRELLSLPDSYTIYFTGSATEVWERISQNLVLQTSAHLVNGAFSRRFYEIAKQLGKKPVCIERALGNGFEYNLEIPDQVELIAVTHNETSTGVALPFNFINHLKDLHPQAIIAVDAVSSLPYPAFSYDQIDTVYFSVQKGFGMPAGLGVWIANENCLAKAESILSKGYGIGSYHNLPTLHQYAQKNQTPETPNVLGIYVLGKVVKDMLARGITAIRRETDYKAAILYQTLNQHPLLSPFVSQKEFQSKTVIAAHAGEHLPRVWETLEKNGLLPGEGYGSLKSTQLRFANFPAHSKEQMEKLVDTLETIG